MVTLDERPQPPALPRFSTDMERFLTAAVGARAPALPVSRRRVGYAIAGLAAVAVAIAVAVGVSGGSARPPLSGRTIGSGPGTGTGSGTATGGVHIHLAAFSVDTNPNGTVTLTLTQAQVFDPSAVRAALAEAGVRAIVTVGSVCVVPGFPSNALPEVIGRSPGTNGASVSVITPSAIPAGQELSFGYFAVPDGGGLHVSLVPVNVPLTCTSTPPAPPHH
jgi:hypothetical protein